MSFSSVIIGEGREGDVTLGYQNKMLVVGETYNYKIRVSVSGGTTYGDVSRSDILTTPGLPVPRQSVSPSGLGYCSNVSITRDPKNISLWDVKATFSSQVDEDSNSSAGGDPTTWVPLRETFLEPFDTVLSRAVNNKPLVNGALVPFASAPSTPKDNIRWEFAQFEPVTVTDEDIADRNNKINDRPYKGRAKHTLLLKIRRSVVGRFYGSLLRLTEYSLTWNPDNWHRKFANQGNSFNTLLDTYPYIYKSDPDVIHIGPLGDRDVKYDEDLVIEDGLPSGGTENVDGKIYAKRPVGAVLHYIERQVFEEANFASFLRI